MDSEEREGSKADETSTHEGAQGKLALHMIERAANMLESNPDDERARTLLLNSISTILTTLEADSCEDKRQVRLGYVEVRDLMLSGGPIGSVLLKLKQIDNAP